jgi:hypothetical protein
MQIQETLKVIIQVKKKDSEIQVPIVEVETEGALQT